jgi:glycosyltransferase involved in cell wall biosynthesis
MSTIKHLTIGVVAKDGMPHLNGCLTSLSCLTDCAETVEFILVDSGSTDCTLNTMCIFASQNKNARVFTMSGTVNQSVTRNVILEKSIPGAVLLVDGDVAINHDFVKAALEEIGVGNADIVYGQLPEIWHTSDHQAYAEGGDRYQISNRRYMHFFMGSVMLGPQVLAKGCRYDREMRRIEDVEFSIRVSEQFRILALPIPMGIHFTTPYHSRYRIGAFYKDSYLRPVGRFVRINLLKPRRLWWARTIFGGNLLGLAEQFCLLLALISANLASIALVSTVIFVDAARFAIRGRVHQYIPIRIRGPWQIISGIFIVERVQPDYKTTEIQFEPPA